MNNPIHVLDLLPKEQRQIVEAADLKLREAYVAFASGNPRKEDCAVIMADLAFYSGYYNTTSELAPDSALRMQEGRRDVFGHIMRYANMPLTEVEQLQRKVTELMNAARGEF